MQSVSRGQRACFHAEFLKRIGKREGQIDIRKGVVVVPAVEQIVCSVGLPPRYGDRDRAVKVLAADFVAPRCAHRRARNQNELRHIAAVQGQFGDALRFHDIGDRSILSLDHAGGCSHLHRFRDRTDRENSVERYVVVHLQHNSRLAVALEPLFLDLELVGSNG